MKRWPVCVGLGAIVVGLLVGLLVWTSPLTGAARPGELFAGTATSSPQAGDRTVRVVLPSGAFDFTVGKPVREIDAGEQDGYPIDDQKTERGDRIVPVSWQAVRERGRGMALEGIVPRITLVSGSQRYALPVLEEDHGIIAARRDWFVVVEGRGEGLKVEVEYDGVVQVADVQSGEVEAGVASSYYADPSALHLDRNGCTFAFPSGRKWDERAFSCTVEDVELTPYVPEMGWVESEGMRWLVVSVLDKFEDYIDTDDDGPFASYDLNATRSITVDGKAPVKVLDAQNAHGVVRARYVFLVADDPRELVIERVHSGKASTTEGPPSPATVRFKGSLRAKFLG